MRDTVIVALACTLCGSGLGREEGALRCGEGHSFDLARQGYLSMLVGTGAGAAADTGAMVAARVRFLAAGHFRPLTDSLVAAATEVFGQSRLRLVVDVGGGTGHHLAALLDALPLEDGLVVDLSRDAVRAAARTHPRMSAVVADLRRGLPLREGVADLLLDVFAPRDGAAMRRAITADGALLVVTPRVGHLGELEDLPGMLRVDARKEERLERSLGGHFRLTARLALDWPMTLGPDGVRDLVLMGPSAHHVDPLALERVIDGLPGHLDVRGSVDLWTWLPL
jgi:23S rRNA (guanine745-N1)-methyltransferase